MMLQTVSDRFRRWFSYEKDAHVKVLASLDTVPSANRSSPEYRKALNLLGHILAARQMWLFRLGAASQPPADLFPTSLSLTGLVGQMEQMHSAWSSFLSRQTDADLARVFEYQSTEGDRFRNRIEDVLTQLFGHSLYHRGQIASLVRAAGGEPAATDFIFWSREPLPSVATR